MSSIRGPNGSIPYRRDINGYPQVTVRDRLEGAYALGYFHALDRLVQVQLLLVTARGRTMEIMGDRPLARMIDHSIHAFNFSGDVEEQAGRMDRRTVAYFQAYCDGFNAGSNVRGTPWALRLLRVPVERFTPQSVLLVYRMISYFGLTSIQHIAEVLTAELLVDGASDKAFEMLLGEGRDALWLSSNPVTLPEAFRVLAPAPLTGSNAFAVSGGRSSTGGALLMGEPHMEVGKFPPVMYAIHIEYEDGYYQGAGPPGLPWLVTGRTQDLAWSYTYAHADNFDIVVEHCRNATHERNNRWYPLQRRTCEVKVRGKRIPERWHFYDNSYGTVVGNANEEDIYLPCIRWSGLAHTGEDCDVIVQLLSCKRVDEAVELYRRVRLVSLAVVMAESRGAIGYVQSGQVDRRQGDWSGVYPYPGWKLSNTSPEPMPEETRPVLIDPPQGFIVSANELRCGPDGTRWSTLPEPSYRHDRLTQLLSIPGKLDPVDMVAASYDPVDLCADRLMRVWKDLLPKSRKSRRLYKWAVSQSEERRGDKKSRKWMGLFHALHHEVTRAVLVPQLGEGQTRRILDTLGMGLAFQVHLDRVLALEKPHLLDREGLRTALHAAWPGALRSYRSGNPVRARFENVVLRGRLPGLMGFSSAKKDFPGGPTVPFQARVTEFEREKMVFGPVFHFLFDMSRPGSLYNIAGGASENRFGPGYGRGVDDWLHGRFREFGVSNTNSH